MRIATILLLCLTLSTLAAPDSLACRMVDWLDAPGTGFYCEGNDSWPPDYAYSGTKNWDLAMGDSFMVWLPGSDRILFLDAYEVSDVDTIANFDYGSVNAQGVTVYDSMIYILGGGAVNTLILRNDSLIWIDTDWTPFASYHFAALEDSFLYTTGGPEGELTCINVADPESIFIYRTLEGMGGRAGLEVIDGYVYQGRLFTGNDEISGDSWVFYTVDRTDMINSPSPEWEYGVYYGWRRFFGDIASDGERIYFANTWLGPWPDWTIGESDFFVLETDTSYNFDDRWDGQPAIGVEIVNDHLAAVGFKHGFSILDIDDLSDIHEVAYYMDPDSEFYCTHFAMKDTVLYAVAHPRDDTCRLYMFHLADSVASGIEEPSPQTARPEDFEIYAYPNPFNSAVTIAIDGLGDGSPVPVSVEIYDVGGRRVADAEPADKPHAVEAGAGRLTNDTSTGSVSVFAPLTKGGQGGSYVWQPDPSLPSGVYLVRANTGANILTKRVMFIK